MTTLLTAAKSYYYAYIIMSLGVVYNLVQQDFVGVGIFLILSALLIAIGFIVSRKNSSEGTP
ncbi:hypothetical protein CXF85_13285 [Colwellia sp. 75C3]|uniref:hypothetical protein n=1 Tax=Colwellia sp. 75C3 TaxID=888425 RepID=UPI000C3390F7|nr:hypothetical protein [Colwellia sp. 75C3]PKG82457.1 hypothetical protein CXF85_13285 [Colwellia sp. 75C3]